MEKSNSGPSIEILFLVFFWWIHWPNCGGYRSVLIWQKTKSADNSNDDGTQHVVVNAESQSATA